MHVGRVRCCRLRFTAFVAVSDRDIHIRRRIRAHRRSSSCSPLRYTAIGMVFGGDIHMQSPRLTHSVSIRIAFGCPHTQTAGLATSPAVTARSSRASLRRISALRTPHQPPRHPAHREFAQVAPDRHIRHHRTGFDTRDLAAVFVRLPFAGNRTDVARSDLLDEIAIRCRRGRRLAELGPNFAAREQTRISSRQPLFMHIEHALARTRRFYRRSEPLISGTVLHQQHTTRTNHSRATVLIPRC